MTTLTSPTGEVITPPDDAGPDRATALISIHHVTPAQIAVQASGALLIDGAAIQAHMSGATAIDRLYTLQDAGWRIVNLTTQLIAQAARSESDAPNAETAADTVDALDGMVTR